MSANESLTNKRTLQNITKAQKEIEKLEAEEATEASGGASAATTNGVNGKKADDKAVEEVTAELKDSSIEEKTEEPATAATAA